MRGMGGILLGKAYHGRMEGVHPARMAQPCGYVGEEEKNGTRRPGYGLGRDVPATGKNYCQRWMARRMPVALWSVSSYSF